MERDFFSSQIERLRSQWPHAYGPERQARLWISFKMLPNEKFKEMVDRALDNSRSAPLAKEFLTYEEELTREENQRKWHYGVQSAGFGLEKYAAQNKLANPDFVKACVKLVQEKTMGKITHEQFLQGCDLLDTAAKSLKGGICA